MATRTISNAGGNYNAVGTWVEGFIPTSADDVVATATSGNLTVNVASSALSIDFTNYVGTFTVNSGITLSMYGNLTFVAGMTIAGTGIIQFTANANLTSNGKTFTGTLSFSGTRTLTLLDDAGVKTLSAPNAVMTTTINGFNLYTENFTNNNGPVWQGTVNLILNPAVSGSWSTSGTGGQLLFTNAIQINCAGTLTMSGQFAFGCSLTRVAGTVIASAALPNFYGTSKTLSTGSAVKFGNMVLNGSYTLSDDLWTLGACTFGASSTFNGYKCYVAGNFGTVNNTHPSGTTEFVLNGSGNISTPNYPNSTLRNPITIDTVGTYTQTSNAIIATTFKHVSGTFNQGVYFLEVGGNCTFDTASMTFTNLRTISFWSATPVITLNSQLKATTLTLLPLSTTFAGAYGFNVSNFIVNTAATAARTMTFAAGIDYNINTKIEVNGTSALPYTFASSSPTIKAKINLFGQQKVTHCNATRIDSSGGLTIYTSIIRTLTDVVNWGLGEGNWWTLLKNH